MVNMTLRALIDGADYTIWSNSIDRDLLISAKSRGSIFCRCGKKLTFVDATDRIPHFRHLAGYCRFEAEPYSPVHDKGIDELALIFASIFGRENVKKEEVIQCKEATRITDVFLTRPLGKPICYELQCSPITYDSVKERTADYEALGYEVVWIFGPRMNNMDGQNMTLSDLFIGKELYPRQTLLSIFHERGYAFLYSPRSSNHFWVAHPTEWRCPKNTSTYERQGVHMTLLPIQFNNEGFPAPMHISEQELIAAVEAMLAGLKEPENSYKARLNKIRRALPTQLKTLYRLSDEAVISAVSKIEERIPKRRSEQESPMPAVTSEISVKIPPSKPKQQEGKPTVVTYHGKCIECEEWITEDHYHICYTCKRHVHELCAKKIEKRLGLEHNMAGWVKHC